LNWEEDDKAIEVLEKLNAREQSTLTQGRLGLVRFFRENYEEALPFYEVLIESLSEEELKAEAFDMIRKAVEEQPDSGAIVDSLGWAHYKLGEYEKAKENLEKAVVLSPSSATIIDHLGDVYWKLGRKREAGFQWKRALEFEPTDEERATIDIKLEGGLEAVPPATDALP